MLQTMLEPVVDPQESAIDKFVQKFGRHFEVFNEVPSLLDLQTILSCFVSMRIGGQVEDYSFEDALNQQTPEEGFAIEDQTVHDAIALLTELEADAYVAQYLVGQVAQVISQRI